MNTSITLPVGSKTDRALDLLGSQVRAFLDPLDRLALALSSPTIGRAIGAARFTEDLEAALETRPNTALHEDENIGRMQKQRGMVLSALNHPLFTGDRNAVLDRLRINCPQINLENQRIAREVAAMLSHPGNWDFAGADVAFELTFRHLAQALNISFRVHSKGVDQSIGTPNAPYVGDLVRIAQREAAHYEIMLPDGRRYDPPADGDCAFHAINLLCQMKERNEFARGYQEGRPRNGGTIPLSIRAQDSAAVAQEILMLREIASAGILACQDEDLTVLRGAVQSDVEDGLRAAEQSFGFQNQTTGARKASGKANSSQSHMRVMLSREVRPFEKVQALSPNQLLDALVTARRKTKEEISEITLRLENILREADLSKQVRLDNRYNNNLYKVEDGDIPIVVKKMHSHEAAYLEELAYKVSEKLGFHLVPPTIAKGKLAIQPFLSGFIEEKRIEAKERKVRGITLPPLAKVFNFLVNQGDDNLGNRMWDQYGNIMLVDHKSTFRHQASFAHVRLIESILMDRVFTEKTWKRFHSISNDDWRGLFRGTAVSLAEDAVEGFLSRLQHIKNLTYRQIDEGVVELRSERITNAQSQSDAVGLAVMKAFGLNVFPHSKETSISEGGQRRIEALHSKFLAQKERMLAELRVARNAELEPVLQELKHLKLSIRRLGEEAGRLKSELIRSHGIGLWNRVQLSLMKRQESPTQRSYHAIKSSLEDQRERVRILESRLVELATRYDHNEEDAVCELKHEMASRIKKAFLSEGVYAEDASQERAAVEAFLKSMVAQSIIDGAIHYRFGVPDKQKSVEIATQELQNAIEKQPYFSRKRDFLSKLGGSANLSGAEVSSSISKIVVTHAARQVKAKIAASRRNQVFEEIERNNIAYEERCAERADEGEALRKARWKSDQMGTKHLLSRHQSS